MSTFQDLAKRLGVIEGDNYNIGQSEVLSNAFNTKDTMTQAEIKSVLLAKCV